MGFEQMKMQRELVRMLLDEQPHYHGVTVPEEETALFVLYRGLVNVRPPIPASDAYLALEDAYFQSIIAGRGIADGGALEGPMAVWRGNITALKADAIVNAANSRLLGCFIPSHRCVDNAIHTFAGVRLRLACHELMRTQGHLEPVGQAKITPAFNLPSRAVIHTVGPVIQDRPTNEDRELLASCYRACIELAQECGLFAIAFCCISTGEFHFPNRLAAEIAVKTVREYQEQFEMKVIFNVFTDLDEAIYRELLL